MKIVRKQQFQFRMAFQKIYGFLVAVLKPAQHWEYVFTCQNIVNQTIKRTS